MSRATDARVLVVGEGIAGIACAVELADKGLPVTLVSRAPLEHSESFARHDGLDAGLEAAGGTPAHREELALGAAKAPPRWLDALAEAGPVVVDELIRRDVPFDRRRDGELALGGSGRTLHASCFTARYLGRRLSQRLLHHERTGCVVRRLGWQALDLVRDADGRARAVVARHFGSGEIEAFEGSPICLATGGHTGLFFPESWAHPSIGSVTGLAFRGGADLVDPAAVLQHPLAYRAHGFVRRLPRRLLELGASVDAGLCDLSGLDRAPLRAAAGPVLAELSLHLGIDPYLEPFPVEAAPDRTLGGLFVTLDAETGRPGAPATTLDGVYALGGAAAMGFGETASAGSFLLAALVLSRSVAREIDALPPPASTNVEAACDARKAARRDQIDEALASAGQAGERPSAWLRRVSKALRTADPRARAAELESCTEGLPRVRVGDGAPRANRELELWLDLEPTLALAHAVALAEASAHEAPRVRWRDSKPVLVEESA